MSRFQKAMVWLGLTDADEDDEYEEDPEESRSRRARHYRADSPPAPTPRVQVFQGPEPSVDERDNIRQLAGERAAARAKSEIRYAAHQDSPPQANRAAFVKPVPAERPKLHLSQPQKFADVQEIGDRFKERQIVLVDMANIPKELSRRVIDFCSGATYGLDGRIEKLSEDVLLLSPSGFELSSQDKDKVLERLSGSRAGDQ